MLVEVGDGERLAAVRTLRALVVVHLADVPRQVGHRELLVTVWTLLHRFMLQEIVSLNGNMGWEHFVADFAGNKLNGIIYVVFTI